jgi:hypothetical protein
VRGRAPSVPVSVQQARLGSVLEIDVTSEALHEHMDWVKGDSRGRCWLGLAARCGDNVPAESSRTGSAQLGFRSASATSRISRAAYGPHAAAASAGDGDAEHNFGDAGSPANAVGRPTPAG